MASAAAISRPVRRTRTTSYGRWAAGRGAPRGSGAAQADDRVLARHDPVRRPSTNSAIAGAMASMNTGAVTTSSAAARTSAASSSRVRVGERRAVMAAVEGITETRSPRFASYSSSSTTDTSIVPSPTLRDSASPSLAISARIGAFSARIRPVKRRIPAARARSASRISSALPSPRPCQASSTVTAISALSVPRLADVARDRDALAGGRDRRRRAPRGRGGRRR